MLIYPLFSEALRKQAAELQDAPYSVKEVSADKIATDNLLLLFAAALRLDTSTRLIPRLLLYICSFPPARRCNDAVARGGE